MVPHAVLCVFPVLAAVTRATAFDSRIIGGEPADIADFPYQLGVYMRDSFLCGGVLIAEQKAITIASCIDNVPEDLRVRAGFTYRDNVVDGEWICVVNYSIPVAYNPRTYDYNIATLYLCSAPTLAVPIPLTKPWDVMPVGENATITGYGTVALGVTTNRLHKAVLRRIDDATCNRLLYGSITARMFCCVGDGVDACQGDGGGPLVYDGKLVGIASWGEECANSPGVYTRIFNSFIYTFIEAN